MRVAPIALFGLGEDRLSSMEAMDKLAAEAAEMTHQNPLGYIPAAMMVHIIYRLATDPVPTRDALYAYTEKAMIAAVNHAGDSDSTGAITGNILGAAIGYEALPEFYKKDLELHDVIIHVADDLYEGKVSKYH